jgi:Holliday junction DNA helicase RuvA
MFQYIKGKLSVANPSWITVETGGIGYKIYIPVSMFSHLPAIGTELLIHTSLIIRDDSQTLFGFLSAQERDVFEEIVNGVNGFGPKLTLNLIGHLPIDDLFIAIRNNDIDSICKVPGIGKKTAQRLVIEMRDKLQKTIGGHIPSEFVIEMGSSHKTQMITDAINALINLGYHGSVAQKAIRKTIHEAPETIDLPGLISHALKNV